MSFSNRWLIRGQLTTVTPLHVGDGGTVTRDELKVGPPDAEEFVHVSSVTSDYMGRPYLPGMALKGVLRQWVTAILGLGNPDMVENVFGSEDPGAPNSVGGKAEFWDAAFCHKADDSCNVPYWNESRVTGVSASVTIDRRTRSASHRRLAHRAFVPPGVSFEVVVAGQDMEEGEVALLIAALEGFNHPENPVTLGADTGNGWGRSTWKLQEIARFTKKDFSEWVSQDSPPVGYSAVKPVPPAEFERLKEEAVSLFSPSAGLPAVEVELTVHFHGPFLVNDPSRTKGGSRSASGEEADHTPLRDCEGRVVIPGASLRGALRSQAERIVRTLNPAAACPGGAGPEACAPVYDVKDVDRLCLTCYVFGAPGWRGAIELSDFVSRGEDKVTRQEFLAIDRFTGGGAHGLKFNADFVYRPVLSGKLTMPLERRYGGLRSPKKWHVNSWALGLIALTLRDLMEGDVTIGFGASKGYGACKATIDRMSVKGASSVDGLRKLMESHGVTEAGLSQLDPSAGLSAGAQLLVVELIEEFLKKIADHSPKASSAQADNG